MHYTDELDEIAVELARSNATAGDRGAILHSLLQGAMRIAHADMGNIQLLDSKGDLRIQVHHGLPRPFLEFFDHVHEGKAACGTALQRADTIVVENVSKSQGIYDQTSMQVMLDAGAQAVQSVPLITNAREVIGVMSMLYREPRSTADHENCVRSRC